MYVVAIEDARGLAVHGEFGEIRPASSLVQVAALDRADDARRDRGRGRRA
jgi:hypothetical protein